MTNRIRKVLKGLVLNTLPTDFGPLTSKISEKNSHMTYGKKLTWLF